MARIPATEVTGVYGWVVKRMARRMLGSVPEQLGVMWHNKQVLKFSFGISHKAEKLNRVDENLKTFAHMAVAGQVGCGFCLDLTYFQAHNKGLDVVKAREVPRWRESAVFTPLERDVLEYAEAMSQTPPTVTDDLVARLLDVLGPAALIELTTWTAVSNLMTRANVALGIESGEFAAACDLEPLARPARGGRPGPRKEPQVVEQRA